VRSVESIFCTFFPRGNYHFLCNFNARFRKKIPQKICFAHCIQKIDLMTLKIYIKSR
jgi:hypothetical protein